MSNQPARSIKLEPPPERLKPFFINCRPVIVLVKPDETEEQAWRHHVKNQPEDIHADIRISTFAEAIFRSSVFVEPMKLKDRKTECIAAQLSKKNQLFISVSS